MNTTSPDSTGTPRLHTLDEFPELTPEEVGRRFLKLIDSLKSFDDLSVERLQDMMHLPMVNAPETSGGYLILRMPDSGWQYSFSYRIDAKYPRYTNAAFEFNHDDGRADMARVCGMDLDAYVAELNKVGFVEREDLAQYDSPMPPVNPDGTTEERRFFRLPGYIFTRGNVGVLVRERREADMPEAKRHHACVEAISVGRMSGN
ncbi:MULTISPECIES: hypothetical protein [unclassified Lysobacter]|uniref:hypothetical protein n=1 Tax=unclassified Lysobacter TaxID=2635362 RepID=UPI001BE9F18B|nr:MULTISPECIES: hypothetical protein [unclassified Lysobacter]MBT2747820.1 hypothetical protein [Lysobacter sp. ISL-42]MBT2751458.1 hypothetical protein [Lysobacter sp. ISL-50]MBT2778233.1 hypothetical protein [Lysobacter sp. ISL-54]MBT2782720.1 hypothetical protein [Lysobacter sp. ISL-52]